MNTIWTYDKGLWLLKTYEECGLKNWVDNDEMSDFLKKNGFYTHEAFKLGNFPYFGIIAYNNEADKKWIVDISFSEDVNLVYIENICSIMMFLKEYKDIFPKNEQKLFVKEYFGDYRAISEIKSFRCFYPGIKDKNGDYKIITWDDEGNSITLYQGNSFGFYDYLKDLGEDLT